jgi:putative Holliday junction resolvase
MGRIAAIDYGMKRIGVAISDPSQKIAFPLTTVPGGFKAIDALRQALKEHLPTLERILIGLPLLLSGKDSDMTLAVREFAKALEIALSIPVELVDERFSSKLADRSLREIHLNRKERTEKMDSTAATLLLQAYLDKDSHAK